MKQTVNMTEGKVSSLILRFFFPIFLTNMLQQVYNIADTIIVGKGIGDNALAAVGNMSSISFLIVGFSSGLTSGFSILLAQHYGAGNYNELRKTLASSIKLSVGIATVLTVGSILILKPVLVLMQTSEVIMKDSLIYGYVIFLGLAATIAYNLCACILRALGDSKTPFIAIMVSTVINIVLNCVFIFMCHWGVFGAAVATVLAQIISTLVCLIKLKKIDIIKLVPADFGKDISLVKELLRNGIPMALMNSITSLGCMVVQYFVNGLGVAYTSAYAACSKYINLFMQPGYAAGLTMSAFTGQNYGAEKYTRIREGLHVCLGIALISYVTLGSVMVFTPHTLAGMMLTGEEPIALAMQYLPICGFMLFAVDILFVFRSGCQAMGRPTIPMISGVVEMVMRIMVIVLFVSKIGFAATAWADAIAWVGALVLNFIAFEVILNRKIREKRCVADCTGKWKMFFNYMRRSLLTVSMRNS